MSYFYFYVISIYYFYSLIDNPRNRTKKTFDVFLLERFKNQQDYWLDVCVSVWCTNWLACLHRIYLYIQITVSKNDAGFLLLFFSLRVTQQSAKGTHTFIHPWVGQSLSPHSRVCQRGRDNSPRRQYRFDTPWPAVPSETPRLSCVCQQKQKSLCQAALASVPPSL